MGLFLPGEEEVLTAMMAETMKLAAARGITHEQLVRVCLGISASVVDTLTAECEEADFEATLDNWCESFRTAARAIRATK